MSATADSGFHAGELAVQRRAGVRDEAARLAPMLERARLSGGMAGFLGSRTFAVITGRDQAGRLWTSALTGPPGFLQAVSPEVLAVHAGFAGADPLYRLPAGQKVGLVAVEFAARRRFRVNGLLAESGDSGLAIEVEQAYGNCPQYIRPRALDAGTFGGPAGTARIGDALAPQDTSLVSAADTFFLGTTHPQRGSDASHRGGPPGFVRVLGDGRLRWADFPGNNLFNSLGNLAVDPEAALLFLDFGTGCTLHLSGTAEVEWDAAQSEQSSSRSVVFSPQRLVALDHPDGDASSASAR
jgi:predicted pyridoxine 5'-phosphate oxidase superfamily flavin-nucleotide-binding protein